MPGIGAAEGRECGIAFSLTRFAAKGGQMQDIAPYCR
jgi:hypothetical protein